MNPRTVRVGLVHACPARSLSPRHYHNDGTCAHYDALPRLTCGPGCPVCQAARAEARMRRRARRRRDFRFGLVILLAVVTMLALAEGLFGGPIQ